MSSHCLIGYQHTPISTEESLQREVSSLKYQLDIQQMRYQQFLKQFEKTDTALQKANIALGTAQDQLLVTRQGLPQVEDFVKMHREIMDVKEEIRALKAVKMLIGCVLDGVLEICEADEISAASNTI